MPWNEHEDDRLPSRHAANKGRQNHVCSVCRKIILRRDDLVQQNNVTYCAEHAPKVDDEQST